MDLAERIEKMREDFLAKALGLGNKSRQDLTDKEHIELIRRAYAYFKKEGFASTFESPYSNHMYLNGLVFEVLEEISPNTKGYDLGELPLWKIRIPSEECVLVAYPEEILLSCQV